MPMGKHNTSWKNQLDRPHDQVERVDSKEEGEGFDKEGNKRY